MIGGPQVMLIAFSGEGATSSQMLSPSAAACVFDFQPYTRYSVGAMSTIAPTMHGVTGSCPARMRGNLRGSQTNSVRAVC
jgi:hypothetical protein